MVEKHNCHYEGEISELRTDMSWIKETLKTLAPKIESMHTTFTQGEGKIKVLNKTVFGNGKVGVVDRIEQLEAKKNQLEGAIKVWIWLFSGGFAVNVFVIVLQMLHVI